MTEREPMSKALDHRIKNFFTVTQGLVSLTARENLMDEAALEKDRQNATHLSQQQGGRYG